MPGKPRVFMPYSGGLRAYRRACASVKDAGFDGFTLTRGGAASDEEAV